MSDQFEDVWSGIRRLVEDTATFQLGYKTPEWEDAVQEGMIKAWTALEAHPEKGRGYFVQAARHGVMNSIAGRSTGKPRRYAADAHDSSHSIYLDDGSIGWDEQVHDVYAVEHDDVLAAVARLDPRDREVAWSRYWLQETLSEISHRTGRSKSAIESHWNRYARPALIEALAS